jgi:glycerate dehydrogenase
MKIVILDSKAENPGDLSWDKISALGETVIYDRTDASDEGQIIDRIGDAGIVITNKTPISARVIDACPGMRYIGVTATGYNIIDIAAARERGIPVTNVPGYGTDSVAQFAMALLLEITSRVGHHDAAVKAGRWEKCEDFCFWDYPLIELRGKTMGIIGFGSIGRRVGELSRAFGMEVLAAGSRPCPEGERTGRYVSLDELLGRADVISLHCPLLDETRELINAETIARMKDGVILINNSRGGLINEKDLAAALESGKVRAAAVDVVSSEPIRGDNPLLHAKNCIITPHISWAPIEARQRIMDMTYENLAAFLRGESQNDVTRL